MARKSDQSLPQIFRLIAAPQASAQGQAIAPPWFNGEYRGHGNTYHLWQAPEFGLQGKAPDWLPNSAGVALVSPALRDQLEALRHPSDIVHWLPVKIKGSGEFDNTVYFLLSLPYRKNCLVIKRKNLDAMGHMVSLPSVSAAAISHARIFTYLSRDPNTCHDVLVRGEVRQALEASGLTGFTFEPVAVTTDAVINDFRPTQRPEKLVYS